MKKLPGGRASKADARRPPGSPPNEPLVVGLSALELAALVRNRLFYDKDYARMRRDEWRTGATWTRVGIIASSATSTIILGLSDLSPLAQIGFGFTALVTALSAVEPFFNWRSRWVAAEEALSEWHRLEESLSLYVANTPEDRLDLSVILKYDDDRCAVWSHFSQQWLQDRRQMADQLS